VTQTLSLKSDILVSSLCFQMGQLVALHLGAVHRGAFAPRYWSSRGCLYHHAYPIGYKASKVHFGRVWVMSIEAGECGPVFRVTDEKTGESFAGVGGCTSQIQLTHSLKPPGSNP
jgi:hypothetical protein